ncbi:hypothetical protein [Nocardia sp. IFM 10818]
MTTRESFSRSLGLAGLVVAGAWAGPMAGGQVALVAKPLGGVLGIPGSVVGYSALAALLTGCATAGLAARRGLSPRWTGWCGIAAGVAWIVAGGTADAMAFAAAVLVAGAAGGPLIMIGRVLVWPHRTALTGWHIAMTAGVAVTAALAAGSADAPGTGLIVAGAAVILHSLIALRAQPIARRGNSIPAAEPATRVPAGYAIAGLVVGGTVLPALHLLLFRWEVLGADQAGLLSAAAVPASIAVALPGPHPRAIAVLLILAAGGPVLVAIAPGRATVTIGLALTLTAAARALRGLDLLASQRPKQPPGTVAITVFIPVAAGLAGWGAVSAAGHAVGAGTALTALAVPVLAAVLLWQRSARTRTVRAPVADPVFEGGTP